MRWLGQAQRAFELMCDRALTRYAHGSLLAEKGAIQTMIAESAAEIQGARLMTLDAARAMDAGSEARVEISLIKFHGAKMLHNVIDRAIQVHGALGVTSDTPLDRMYREARYGRHLRRPRRGAPHGRRPQSPAELQGPRALVVTPAPAWARREPPRFRRRPLGGSSR